MAFVARGFSFSDWLTWLVLAWGASVLGYGLWQWSRSAFGAAVAVVLGLVLAAVLGRRRRRLRGYWVEYVSPAVLRAGEGELALVYHEGTEKIVFRGVERPAPARNLLFVPRDWDRTVEPWARGRREVILERLRANRIAGRCELVDANF